MFFNVKYSHSNTVVLNFYQNLLSFSDFDFSDAQREVLLYVTNLADFADIHTYEKLLGEVSDHIQAWKPEESFKLFQIKISDLQISKPILVLTKLTIAKARGDSSQVAIHLKALSHLLEIYKACSHQNSIIRQNYKLRETTTRLQPQLLSSFHDLLRNQPELMYLVVRVLHRMVDMCFLNNSQTLTEFYLFVARMYTRDRIHNEEMLLQLVQV